MDSAEKLSGQPRQQALRKLASELKAAAVGAADHAKAEMLAGAVNELASAQMTPAATTASR